MENHSHHSPYYQMDPNINNNYVDKIISNQWQPQTSTCTSTPYEHHHNHRQILGQIYPDNNRPISPTYHQSQGVYNNNILFPQNLSLNSSGNTNQYTDDSYNTGTSSSHNNNNPWQFPHYSNNSNNNNNIKYEQQENIQPINFSSRVDSPENINDKFTQFLENYNSYKRQSHNYNNFRMEEPFIQSQLNMNTTVSQPLEKQHQEDLINSPKPRPFVCPFENCQKSYIKRGHLNDHMKIHTGIKTYQCTYEIPLPNDKVTIDSKGNQITHTLCGQSFLRCDELTRHRRTHYNEKPFMCPYCPKAFLRTDHRRAHIRRHPAHERADPEYEEVLLKRYSLVKIMTRKRKTIS